MTARAIGKGLGLGRRSRAGHAVAFAHPLGGGRQPVHEAATEFVTWEHGTGDEEALDSKSLTAAFPIPVTVEMSERRLPETVEVGAYFFIAESLTNVIKHADATSAEVSLRVRPDGSILIEVHDDGRGGAQAVPGRGLAGMQDRLAALEGTVSIDSPLGGGTRVRAVLPLALRRPGAASAPPTPAGAPAASR